MTLTVFTMALSSQAIIIAVLVVVCVALLLLARWHATQPHVHEYGLPVAVPPPQGVLLTG